MEFLGTNGEWNLTETTDSFIIDTNSPNWHICETISKEEQDLANAKLISCAPEMLEALSLSESYLRNVADNKFLADKLEQLIKKATEL